MRTDIMRKPRSSLTQLARTLMDLARLEETVPQQIDFSRCINEARAILIASGGAQYDWVLDAPTGLIVFGWESRLRNALIDLGLNSIQAMPDGGEIRIDWCQTFLDGSFASQSLLPIHPGEYLALAFEDTGCGITPENILQLFDPYFTTKPNGTGLGLPNVIATMRLHRGTVTVTSTMGQGARFTLYLPLEPAAGLSGTSGGPAT